MSPLGTAPCMIIPHTTRTDTHQSCQVRKKRWPNFISQTSLLKAVHIEEVKSATTTDSTLWAVIKMIQTWQRHEVKNYKQSHGITHASLLYFHNIQDEFTVKNSANLILPATWSSYHIFLDFICIVGIVIAQHPSNKKFISPVTFLSNKFDSISNVQLWTS